MRNPTLLIVGLATLVVFTASCGNAPAKPAVPPPQAEPQAAAPAAAPAIVIPDDPPEQRFKAADLNADGLLDDAEMRAEAKRMRGPNAPAAGEEAFFQEAKSILMPADTDKDGKISRNEYLIWSKAGDPK